jgi:hypothetical protein
MAALGVITEASYAGVFNNERNLTANPAEHLKRAKQILARGWNSELLYAALEIRFALERMLQHELSMAEDVSRRMAKEPSPTKQLRAMRRIDPHSAHPHEFFMVGKNGERLKVGDYKPLDQARVDTMHGRLGDLLHPKVGLLLGIPDDPWYAETRKFLKGSASYLTERYDGNTPFFTFSGLDHIDVVRSQVE